MKKKWFVSEADLNKYFCYLRLIVLEYVIHLHLGQDQACLNERVFCKVKV